MPDTIEDRAVVIRMRRRAPGETVKHKRDAPPLALLRTRLREWIRANGKTLEAATPLMPLEDRAADTWEPLFAVADLAGGQWPDLVRQAALTLTAVKEASDEQRRHRAAHPPARPGRPARRPGAGTAGTAGTAATPQVNPVPA